MLGYYLRSKELAGLTERVEKVSPYNQLLASTLKTTKANSTT
jgi:hypothetical protein